MNTLSTIFRNCLPMFVATPLLNGGLYQVMFCFLFIAVWLFMLFVLVYWRECSYSLFLSACWYMAVALLNVLAFDDMLLSRLLMDVGMFLMMVGG